MAALRKIDDVVDTFRCILELMTLMKLDMANFMLRLARTEIAANSVQYEKEKFSKYLREFHGNGGLLAKKNYNAFIYWECHYFQLVFRPLRIGCSVTGPVAAMMRPFTMPTCS